MKRKSKKEHKEQTEQKRNGKMKCKDIKRKEKKGRRKRKRKGSQERRDTRWEQKLGNAEKEEEGRKRERVFIDFCHHLKHEFNLPGRIYRTP
jgi:hypothetical protein